MKNVLFGLSLLVGFSVQAAMPEIASCTIAQDKSTRLLTVTYELLNSEAIVTMDVLTNGVSIGRTKFANAQGAVNRLVSAGSSQTITWQPNQAWPDIRLREPILSVKLTARPVDNPPAYMVVPLEGDGVGGCTYYETVDELPDGIESDVYRMSKLLLTRIHAANKAWDMGSPTNRTAHVDDETLHHVALTSDFWMGVFEVTQYQFEKVYGTHKGTFTAEADTRPVESVTYFEVRADPDDKTAYFKPGEPYSGSFMDKLRALARQDFDLPTEAQWEFACRAGTTSEYYNGTDDTRPEARIGESKAAATTAPAVGGTNRVGSYEPNGFGLYDMYGNVSEWCVDCYNETDYGLPSLAGQLLDPCNWNNPLTTSTTTRNRKYLRRGGGYRDGVKYGRSAARYQWDGAVDSVGFRVICYGPLKAE